MTSKKAHIAVIHLNNEHTLVVGRTYTFTHNDGSMYVGKLLYMYTHRIYDVDEKGNINPKKWKVVQFRTGFEPVPAQPGVYSVHMGCGCFKVSK